MHSTLRTRRSLLVRHCSARWVDTSNAMSLEVFTEKSFSTSTIETMSAKFRVVCADTIADLETLDFLSNGSHFSHRLMAGD